eukprot:6231520-Heterocapsa_arctica.AAC.1
MRCSRRKRRRWRMMSAHRTTTTGRSSRQCRRCRQQAKTRLSTRRPLLRVADVGAEVFSPT